MQDDEGPGQGTLDVHSFHITMTSGGPTSSSTSRTPPCPTASVCPRWATSSSSPARSRRILTSTYPDGLAIPLKAGDQLILQSHYVNASTDTIHGQVDVDMDLMTRTSPTTSRRSLTGRRNLTVRRRRTDTPTAARTLRKIRRSTYFRSARTCTSAAFISRSTRWKARRWSTVFLDTTDWHAPPITTFQPAPLGVAGRSFHYQCTWNNETTHPIYFGPTTEDEMCIMVVTVYPAPDFPLN